ncbi:MAG: recombination-associated protein RdgC, partial [Flavobacterium psychrophilum]
TEWVKESKPAEGFTIMDEAELKAILEDGGVIQSKKQDLASEEIQNHIEAGKQVTKLALNWKESVDFVFSLDASIKRIKLSDTVKEQNSDIDADDHAQRFDADFVLYTGTLTDLILELKKVFSSEDDETEE